MSRIYAMLGSKRTGELGSASLPVEVRRLDGALVARGVSHDYIEVVPGRYIVISVMPGGTEMAGEVDVSSDQTATVTLTPEPEDESPSVSQEVPRFVWGHTGVDVPAGVEEAAFAMHGKLRLWSGNVLEGTLRPEATDGLRQLPEPLPDGVIAFKPTVTGLLYAQLAQSGHPAVNVVIARDPESVRASTRLVVVLRADGSFDVEARPEDLAADALLAFLEHGRFGDALAVADTAEMSQELLLRKKRDPLAASVGAYALLRMSAYERLHDWTQNLCSWFTWLPDGVVIRAEHLAREGQRRDALELLLTLNERGLPVFTEGFSLALDRLRATEDPRARNLLNQLSEYVPFVDFSRPFLTFHGEEPGHAGLSKLDEGAYDHIEGLVVTPHGVCEPAY
jgi:hypothetical protein